MFTLDCVKIDTDFVSIMLIVIAFILILISIYHNHTVIERLRLEKLAREKTQSPRRPVKTAKTTKVNKVQDSSNTDVTLTDVSI